MVPVLSLGTGTFGGGNSEFFKAWGSTDAAAASRLVDICLDAGLNMFDSADVYSKGLAEEILGFARQAVTEESRAPRIGPEVAAPEGASATERLMAYMGRNPRE